MITFFFSWLLFSSFIIFDGDVYSPFFSIVILVYMWVPGILALFFYRREKRTIPFRTHRHRGYFYAGLLPILLIFLTILMSLPFFERRSVEGLQTVLPFFLRTQDIRLFFVFFFTYAIFMALLSGYGINLFICLGQELMWRGYLWDKLRIFGFWKASSAIGFFWGLWYAPLVLTGWNYPDHPYKGILAMILFCVLLTPLLLYSRMTTKSVVAPSIFHGVMNAFSGTGVYLFYSPDHLRVGFAGLFGLAVLAGADLVLFFKIRKKKLLLQYD